MEYIVVAVVFYFVGVFTRPLLVSLVDKIKAKIKAKL